MSTQLFPGGASPMQPDCYPSATPWLDANTSGSAESAIGISSTGRGIGVATAGGTTVAGPASRLVFTCLTDPLSAAVTISGTITVNVWAAESSMSANVGWYVEVYRVKGDGSGDTLVATVTASAEVATTTRAATSNTATPTSTAFAKGDRIRVRFGWTDVGGTQAATFTYTMSYGGASAAADGDTFITFTENLTFMSIPFSVGSTYYPTTQASGISTGGREDLALLTAQTPNSSTRIAGWGAAGPMAAIFYVNGVNTSCWWTPALAAQTIATACKVSLYRVDNGSASFDTWRVRLVKRTSGGVETTIVDAASIAEVGSALTAFLQTSGDDVTLASGDRLGLFFLADDYPLRAVSAASSHTMTFDNAINMTKIEFQATLVEQGAGGADPTFPYQGSGGYYGT